jgi:hypothetical protein
LDGCKRGSERRLKVNVEVGVRFLRQTQVRDEMKEEGGCSRQRKYLAQSTSTQAETAETWWETTEVWWGRHFAELGVCRRGDKLHIGYNAWDCSFILV